MGKKKNIVQLLSVAVLAFSVGLLTHGLLKKKPEKNTIKDEVTNPLIPETKEAPVISEEARQKYRELLAEYVKYISNNDTAQLSFLEFMSIKKDSMIQAGVYSEDDIELDKEIKVWYDHNTKNSEEQDVETQKYTVSGSINSPYKDQDGCYIVAGIYTSSIENILPDFNQDSVTIKTPIAYKMFDDCSGGDFSIDFKLSNVKGEDTVPIYIYAYAYNITSGTSIIPFAFGTNEQVNGVPPSILIKKKNNEPITIQLKKMSHTDMSNIMLDLNIEKGLWVSLHGLDGILSMVPEYQGYKTSISGQDNIARLNGLPFGSNMELVIFDDKLENKIEVNIPVICNPILIGLPKQVKLLKEQTSLVIIPPLDMPSGDIVINSMESQKNKKNIKLSSFNNKPIILSNMDPGELVLELKNNNNSLGISKIHLKKGVTKIFAPTPKNIKSLRGRVYIDKSACKGCLLEVKYSGQNCTTSDNGSFEVENIEIIDNTMIILTEVDGLIFEVPIPTHQFVSKLDLELKLPSRATIMKWNKIEATTPINGMIHGSFRSQEPYRAFIASLDNKKNYEAFYIEPSVEMIERNKINTTSDFIFTNIPEGRYQIYLISSSGILHTRNIEVKAEQITIFR